MPLNSSLVRNRSNRSSGLQHCLPPTTNPNSHNTLVELQLEVQIPDVYNTSQNSRQKLNDHKTPEGVWSAQNGRALATSNHNEE